MAYVNGRIVFNKPRSTYGAGNLGVAQNVADQQAIKSGRMSYRDGALTANPQASTSGSAASTFGSLVGGGGSQLDPYTAAITGNWSGYGIGSQSAAAPQTTTQGNQFGPDIFEAAITGGLTPEQSSALRTYYNANLWNGFTGTDESATGGLGGAGGSGGSGGAGSGGNLSGSTLNYSTLGPERLQAQNALDLAILGQQGRQTSIDKFLPLISQVFGAIGGDGASLTGNQPTINAGPIYTPQQMQQAINAGVAGNDSRYAGLVRSLASRFGSAGFAPSSSALAALTAQLGARNAADNATVRREVPFGMASGNASQLLGSQVAQENQFSNRQQEQLSAKRNAISMLASVLGLV